MRKIFLILLVVLIGFVFVMAAPEIIAPSKPISENYGFVRLHPRDGKFIVPEGACVYLVVTPNPETFQGGTTMIFERRAGTGFNLEGNARINLKIIKEK